METEYKPNYAVHPGVLLKEDLKMRKMSQKEFADSIGIQKSVINEIIKGKRNINAHQAVLFEKILYDSSDAGFWLRAQAFYDETVARLSLEKHNQTSIKKEQNITMEYTIAPTSEERYALMYIKAVA